MIEKKSDARVDIDTTAERPREGEVAQTTKKTLRVVGRSVRVSTGLRAGDGGNGRIGIGIAS